MIDLIFWIRPQYKELRVRTDKEFVHHGKHRSQKQPEALWRHSHVVAPGMRSPLALLSLRLCLASAMAMPSLCCWVTSVPVTSCKELTLTLPPVLKKRTPFTWQERFTAHWSKQDQTKTTVTQTESLVLNLKLIFIKRN